MGFLAEISTQEGLHSLTPCSQSWPSLKQGTANSHKLQGQGWESCGDTEVPMPGASIWSLPQIPCEMQGSVAERIKHHPGGKEVRAPASSQPETCSVMQGKLLAFSMPQCFCLSKGDGNRRDAAYSCCSTGQAHTCISSSSAMRSASVTCWLVRKALSPRNLSSKYCSALSTAVLLRSIFSWGT